MRYAWGMNPSQRNLLYNREGIPASPFRTDDWPLFDPDGEIVTVIKPEKTEVKTEADWERPAMTQKRPDNSPAPPAPADSDPVQTREWEESLDEVVAEQGGGRAEYLLARVFERARRSGLRLPAAEIRLEAGRNVVVPLANLEVIA